MKRYLLLFTPLFFLLLTLLLTYPLILHLPTYVADLGDPLLNTWALAWGRHALLLPWFSVSDLFNANAFYPYPHSLGFSENLLIYAALTLPLTALNLGPIFAHNGAILFSMTLAGWGMALLVAYWTKSRWAGLVAGVIFAFVPARLNHWAHLHQLSVHWLPFIVLYLNRWLVRRRWRDLVLFGLFLNFQLLSTINYIPQTIILVGIFFLHGLIRFPRHPFSKESDRTGVRQRKMKITPQAPRPAALFSPVVIGGGLAVLAATILINWPIATIYFELSELHGFERGLGDARIYGAALTDYAIPPPENVLYGDWLTPRLAQPGRPLIPLFVGIVPVVLCLLGLSTLLWRDDFSARLRKLVLSLLLLTILALFLSFGANEQALGERFSPLTRHLLLYRWLFEYVPGFSGLRVPARAAILIYFGVAALAGIGMASLIKTFRFFKTILIVVVSLLVIEYLPLPLPGTQVAIGKNIPPVYQQLAVDSANKVVLELPYDLAQGGPHELPRLYYSSYGWYKLVNGASGYNPAGSEDLSRLMQRFPDATALDALRQLGVTHLVLHVPEFTPERWQDIWSKLPTYWPSISSLSQYGDDYLLTLRPPACSPRAESVIIQSTKIDGQLGLIFTNKGPTTFVTNPQTVNQLETSGQTRHFVEPLFIPAGEKLQLDRLLPVSPDFDQPIRLNLPGLSVKGDVLPGGTIPAANDSEDLISPPETPLDIEYGEALRLLGYSLQSHDGTNCRTARLRLYWAAGRNFDPQLRRVVRLVDRFGQTIASATASPVEWQHVSQAGKNVLIDDHQIPVVETVPPGQFGLTLEVLDKDDTPYQPTNAANLIVVGPEVLLNDLLVRPMSPVTDFSVSEVLATFENGITLVGYEVDKAILSPGDWLHLTLYWQSKDVISADLTVFTQLLDMDGQVRGQHDNPPRSGWYPTTLWQPGEVIPDDYFIFLDPETPAGELKLIVGLYHPDSLARVAVIDEAGEQFGDSLAVTLLNVSADD